MNISWPAATPSRNTDEPSRSPADDACRSARAAGPRPRGAERRPGRRAAAPIRVATADSSSSISVHVASWRARKRVGLAEHAQLLALGRAGAHVVEVQRDPAAFGDAPLGSDDACSVRKATMVTGRTSSGSTANHGRTVARSTALTAEPTSKVRATTSATAAR